ARRRRPRALRAAGYWRSRSVATTAASCVHLVNRLKRNELRGVDRRLPLEPGVPGQRLRLPQPIEQALFHVFRRVCRVFPYLIDPTALDEVVRPLEIVAVLAVVLEKELGGLERLFSRLDGDQQIRFAPRFARGPADDHLPAPLLADQPDVLD